MCVLASKYCDTRVEVREWLSGVSFLLLLCGSQGWNFSMQSVASTFILLSYWHRVGMCVVGLYMCFCLSVYICASVCVCVCVSWWACVCSFAWLCACASVCICEEEEWAFIMRVCMVVHLCMCVCVVVGLLVVNVCLHGYVHVWICVCGRLVCVCAVVCTFVCECMWRPSCFWPVLYHSSSEENEDILPPPPRCWDYRPGSPNKVSLF